MNILKKKIDCGLCDGTAVLTEKSSVLVYKGRDVTIKGIFYKCSKCGIGFTFGDMDDINVARVHKGYKELNK